MNKDVTFELDQWRSVRLSATHVSLLQVLGSPLGELCTLGSLYIKPRGGLVLPFDRVSDTNE